MEQIELENRNAGWQPQQSAETLLELC